MARFFLPDDIYYGRGTLEKLRSLDGSRAVLITGGLKKSTELIELVRSYMTQNGMNVRLINETNIITQSLRIRSGAKSMREFRPDWIVAMGDGATLSAAKIMWILFEHTWMRLESLEEEAEFPMLGKQARFAALPAGFGMAADASALCSVLDESLSLRISSEHRALTPDMVILDPLLTEYIPFAISAYNSLDSLCYTLEALLSEKATMLTDAFANQAAAELFRYLALCFGGNVNAKEKVYYAQFASGCAYANTGEGFISELSMQILSSLNQYHLPHGCVSAILLPSYIRMKKDTQIRFKGVMGLLGKPVEEHSIAEEIAGMTESLLIAGGIPGSFEALGVRQRDFFEALPTILKVFTEKVPKTKEYPLNEKELENLLKTVYSASK